MSGQHGTRRGNVVASNVSALRVAIGGMGEVRGPDESEEPILGPVARAAIFEWLAEIRARDDLKSVGLKPRATALLHGPPGCGKTTLAHHLAARLGVPLVMVGAEGLVTKYMGETAQKIAALFDAIARTERPSILLLDEIDALGAKRSNHDSSASRDNNQALTVLLRKVEGFQGMMIGATNLPEQLDTALWRRFAIHLGVDLPGPDERYAILARYFAPFVVAEDDLDILTDATDGASPALLRGLAEGVKRAMVLWPRLGRDLSSPVPVLRAVVASVRPPPEIPPPPLWGDADAPEALAAMAWPLVMTAPADA